MNNKLITLIVVIAFIAGAIVLLTNPFKREQSPLTDTASSNSSSEVGQKIPEFELEDFNGEKVKIATPSGKPVFIDFWAAWCPFCIDEMPEIEKIHKEFGPPAGGLIVLGIHRSETETIDAGAKFAKERGVTYTLLKDSTGAVYKTLTGGRNFMPYALYIDKMGKIVKTKAGPKTAEEMRQAVQELLR